MNELATRRGFKEARNCARFSSGETVGLLYCGVVAAAGIWWVAVEGTVNGEADEYTELPEAEAGPFDSIEGGKA